MTKRLLLFALISYGLMEACLQGQSISMTTEERWAMADLVIEGDLEEANFQVIHGEVFTAYSLIDRESGEQISILEPGGMMEGRRVRYCPNNGLYEGISGRFYLQQLGQRYDERYAVLRREVLDHRLARSRQSAIEITGVSKLEVAAGNQDTLVIEGLGFGDFVQGQSKMAFSNPESTEANDFTNVPNSYILDWTDEYIEVLVPGYDQSVGAGSGPIMVLSAADELAVSDFSVRVKFNKREHQYGPVDLIDSNSESGYTFHLQTALAANQEAVDALSRALNQLKCKTGVAFSIGETLDTTNCLYADGINLISFESDCETWPFSGAAAWTRVVENADCGLAWIEEIDIIFVDALNFHFGTEHPPSNAFDFQTVALHELGHAMGMAHSRDSEAVMYSEISSGDSNRTIEPWFQECADIIMSDSAIENECGPGPIASIEEDCEAQITTEQIFVNMCHKEVYPVCFEMLKGEGQYEEQYELEVVSSPANGQLYFVCGGCDLLESDLLLDAEMDCAGAEGYAEAMVVYQPDPGFVGQDTFVIRYANTDAAALVSLDQRQIAFVNNCAPSFIGECSIDFEFTQLSDQVYQFSPVNPFVFSESMMAIFADDTYSYTWDFAEGDPIAFEAALDQEPLTTFAFANEGLHLVCLQLDGPECVQQNCKLVDVAFAECGTEGGPQPMDWYADMDGDGLGDVNEVVSDTCLPPANYVGNADDPDDDCFSNLLDECGVCDGTGPQEWFADEDGDGLGDPALSVLSCTEVFGYVDNALDVDDSVGLGSLRTDAITLYPNPANRFLLIESTEAINQLQLRSIDGRLIKQMTQMNSRIDLQGYSPGVYLLSVEVNGNWLCRRLLIH